MKALKLKGGAKWIASFIIKEVSNNSEAIKKGENEIVKL